MEYNINKFCRSLTPAEKKEYKKYGLVENMFPTGPFLAWKDKLGLELGLNRIYLFILSNNSFFVTFDSEHVAIKECIAVVAKATRCEENFFFFEIDKATEALQFYNQMLVALKNNNY